MSVIEPHASPISERMAAIKKAHKLGLRTYGMLCPCCRASPMAPSRSTSWFGSSGTVVPREVFSEAINARGNGLTLTEQVLREAGFLAEAGAISRVRRRRRGRHTWSICCRTSRRR